MEADPRRDDFLKLLIERRHEVQQARDAAIRSGDAARAGHLDGIQHGLKIVANSVYGVMAEIDEKTTGAREADVFGVGHFLAPITREEHLGPYAFPPVAALFTSGARLIMAMLEVELRRRKVFWAFMDTDSVAVVGGPGVVRAVRKRLARLTPYAFGGDLLKLEPENEPDPRAKKDPRLYFYGISAKRYVLFNRADDGTIIVRKASEHGLGHLLPPDAAGGKDWIAETWTAILRWEGGEVKDIGDDLPFADLPALGRFPITKPSILAQFAHLNTRFHGEAGKRVPLPYAQQVKPFNFMLVAFPDTGDITTGGEAYWGNLEDGAGPGSGQGRHPIRPVAPYESDPQKWPLLPWVDLHTGRPVTLIWGRRDAGLVTGASRSRPTGTACAGTSHIRRPRRLGRTACPAGRTRGASCRAYAFAWPGSCTSARSPTNSRRRKPG